MAVPERLDATRRTIFILIMLAQAVDPLAVFAVSAIGPLLRESLHLSRGQGEALMGSSCQSWGMLMLWRILGIACLSAVLTSSQKLHPLLPCAQIVACLLLR